MMETGESIYEKVYTSPRPPPKISFTDNWIKNWIQQFLEVAKILNKSNQNPIIKHDETCGRATICFAY